MSPFIHFLLLGRPTYMLADLYFTTDSSSSFFFYLPSNLRARLTELNQSRPHGRKYVRFENAFPKSGVSFPLTNRGPKTTFFGRLHNFMAILTAYIFGTKHDLDNRSSAFKLEGVSYIVAKQHELWSTNGLKPDRSFTHPHYFVLSQSTTHSLQLRFEAQKDAKLEMLWGRVALSGNTSL